MQQKCLIVLTSVLCVASAASIRQHKRSADIPVQVVYEGTIAQVRNLEEKPQVAISPEEQINLAPISALKNLEAKPQVIRGEEKIVTPDEPATQQQQPHNNDYIYQQIKEIINNGAKKIHEDFQKIPDDPQKQQILEKVDNTLGEFLENTKKLISLRGLNTLKQDAATTASPASIPTNFFQEIVGSFQTITNNFIQGISGTRTNQTGTTLGDATTAAPGFPFSIQQAIQNVFSQLQFSLANFAGGVPPQNDQASTGSGPPTASNPFQFITNLFIPSNQAGSTQNEGATQPSNPVAGIVQFVQTAFQGPTTTKPAVHDEVTQPTTPGGPLSIFQTALQGSPLNPSAASAAIPANPISTGQITNQIPSNPAQQQTQEALHQGANQAGQVVAQLSQQGVPVPPGVAAAIGQAQGVGSPPAKAVAPVVAETLVVSEVPSTPATANAIPSVPKLLAVPASDVLGDDEGAQSEESSEVSVPETGAIAEAEQVAVPIQEEISNEVNETHEEQKTEEHTIEKEKVDA